MTWDPKQYLLFRNQRSRPRTRSDRPHTAAARSIVDLGCGTGEVTEALQARWPASQITGVDNSPGMLAHARKRTAQIRWIEADIVAWRPEAPVDLVFSNAVLHWIDDHAALFPLLLESVAPGGVFAAQIPRNWDAPSHQAIYEMARKGSWHERLEALIPPRSALAPKDYYDMLAPLVSNLEIWETEYLQILEGENPVAEYVKGTWLRRFLEALEEPDRTRFESAYRDRVREAYPPRRDGKTLFPIRRLFILASR